MLLSFAGGVASAGWLLFSSLGPLGPAPEFPASGAPLLPAGPEEAEGAAGLPPKGAVGDSNVPLGLAVEPRLLSFAGADKVIVPLAL